MNHERLLRQTVSRRVEGDVINVYNVQFIQCDSRKECGDAYLSRLPTLFKNGNTETEDRWFYKKKNESYLELTLPHLHKVNSTQGSMLHLGSSLRCWHRHESAALQIPTPV